MRVVSISSSHSRQESVKLSLKTEACKLESFCIMCLHSEVHHTSIQMTLVIGFWVDVVLLLVAVEEEGGARVVTVLTLV